MGLDQYAFQRNKNTKLNGEYTEEDRDNIKYEWRKHARLQVFMRDLYRQKNPNINKTQIIVFDNNKSGYRTINIEKIIEIRCGDCKIIDSEYKATLEQDKAYTKELDMENFILETLLKNKTTESEIVNGTRSIRISKKQKH